MAEETEDPEKQRLQSAHAERKGKNSKKIPVFLYFHFFILTVADIEMGIAPNSFLLSYILRCRTVCRQWSHEARYESSVLP